MLPLFVYILLAVGYLLMLGLTERSAERYVRAESRAPERTRIHVRVPFGPAPRCAPSPRRRVLDAKVRAFDA